MRKTFFHYSFKILKVLFVLIFCGTLMSATFLALSAPAASAQYTPTPPPADTEEKNKSIDFTPQLTIPGSSFKRGKSMAVGTPTNGTMTSDLLVKYIKAFYQYGLGIAGILAAIVLMAGGVLWLTSAGNDTKIGQAKELIGGSITGVAILFCSWIILNTINPDLVNLKPIVTRTIKKINIVCCEFKEDNKQKADMLDEQTCLSKTSGKRYDTFYSAGTWSFYSLDVAAQKCVTPGCCVMRSNNNQIYTCFDTISSQCNIGAKTKFYNGLPCASVPPEASGPSCPENVCHKPETKDGDNCWADVSGVNNPSGWCYNKICWRDLGEAGEPCGNDGGKCTPKGGLGWQTVFSWEPTCEGSTSSHDKGGRSCGPDLFCCYQE